MIRRTAVIVALVLSGAAQAKPSTLATDANGYLRGMGHITANAIVSFIHDRGGTEQVTLTKRAVDLSGRPWATLDASGDMLQDIIELPELAWPCMHRNRNLRRVLADHIDEHGARLVTFSCIYPGGNASIHVLRLRQGNDRLIAGLQAHYRITNTTLRSLGRDLIPSASNIKAAATTGCELARQVGLCNPYERPEID